MGVEQSGRLPVGGAGVAHQAGVHARTGQVFMLAQLGNTLAAVGAAGVVPVAGAPGVLAITDVNVARYRFYKTGLI